MWNHRIFQPDNFSVSYGAFEDLELELSFSSGLIKEKLVPLQEKVLCSLGFQSVIICHCRPVELSP